MHPVENCINSKVHFTAESDGPELTLLLSLLLLFYATCSNTLSAARSVCQRKKEKETKTHLQKCTYHIRIYVHRMTVHTRRDILQDVVIFLFRAVCAIASQRVNVCVFYRTCFVAKQCDAAFQWTVKMTATD